MLVTVVEILQPVALGIIPLFLTFQNSKLTTPSLTWNSRPCPPLCLFCNFYCLQCAPQFANKFYECQCSTKVLNELVGVGDQLEGLTLKFQQDSGVMALSFLRKTCSDPGQCGQLQPTLKQIQYSLVSYSEDSKAASVRTTIPYSNLF